MFYSNCLLVKKGGRFSTIWLAAHHWDKNFKKDLIDETNIPTSVNNVIEGVPLALRLSGQLLLGIVRIFSRKVRYVQAQSTDALNQMKSFASKKKNIDLPPTAIVAPPAAITIPESDSMDQVLLPFQLPLLDEVEISRYAMEQAEISRHAIERESTAFMLEPPPMGVELMDDSRLLGRPTDISRVSLQPEAAEISRHAIERESTAFMLEQPSPMGVELTDDSRLLGRPTDISRVSLQPEEELLQPQEMEVEVPELDKKPKLYKRKRFLEMDAEVEIASSQIKEQLSSAEGLFLERKIAPLSKKQKFIHLFEKTNMPLLIYQQSLDDLSNPPFFLPEPTLQLSHILKEEIERGRKELAEIPEEVSAFEIPEIFPMKEEIPEIEMKEIPEIEMKEEIPEIELKEVELPEETQEHKALPGSAIKGWSRHTVEIYNSLGKILSKKKDIHFETLLGSIELPSTLSNRLELTTRQKVAFLFYEILILKSTNYISLSQSEPFGDISISKGNEMFNL